MVLIVSSALYTSSSGELIRIVPISCIALAFTVCWSVVLLALRNKYITWLFDGDFTLFVVEDGKVTQTGQAVWAKDNVFKVRLGSNQQSIFSKGYKVHYNHTINLDGMLVTLPLWALFCRMGEVNTQAIYEMFLKEAKEFDLCEYFEGLVQELFVHRGDEIGVCAKRFVTKKTTQEDLIASLEALIELPPNKLPKGFFLVDVGFDDPEVL